MNDITVETGDMSETVVPDGFFLQYEPIQRPSIWRRLWFVVSCIPRYLISGSVEVP